MAETAMENTVDDDSPSAAGIDSRWISGAGSKWACLKSRWAINEPDDPKEPEPEFLERRHGTDCNL